MKPQRSRSLAQRQMRLRPIHRSIQWAAILFCIFVQCSCAQLFALPMQVLAMPFYAFKFIGGLLPLAIKYAPLALLFIDNNQEQPLYYASLPHGVTRVYSTDGRVCYAVPLETDAQRRLIEYAVTDPAAHVVFVHDRSALTDVRGLATADRTLDGRHVRYACDEEILRVISSRDVAM